MIAGGKDSAEGLDIDAIIGCVDEEIGREITDIEARKPDPLAPADEQVKYGHDVAEKLGQREGLYRLREAIEAERSKRTP